MKIFGISFAPLNVPLRRRLQTAAVTLWAIALLGFGSILSHILIILILLYTKWLRILLLFYFLWMYYDNNTCNVGGRRGTWTLWIRNNLLWKYFAEYFPLKLVKTVDLPCDKNYLFCAFPHGMLATGVFGAFCTDALDCKKLFPGFNFHATTLEQHFKTPFFRDFILSIGVCSASAKSINYLLSFKKSTIFQNEINKQVSTTRRNTKGTNNIHTNSESSGAQEIESSDKMNIVILIVGGASESYNCKPGMYRIILSRRKGFVKIALKNGTPLVPVFAFGETNLYDQVTGSKGSLFRRTQEFIQKIIGVAPIILRGRGIFQYTFGILPRRHPVTVVVGAPLEVPKISEPTQEQVDFYHQKFISCLRELFDQQKYLCNEENASLEIE